MFVALAGDEVVQWNGIRLRGLTFEEVYDIIFESKFDPQVELTVYRPVGNTQQRRNDADCLANTEGSPSAHSSRFFFIRCFHSLICDFGAIDLLNGIVVFFVWVNVFSPFSLYFFLRSKPPSS